MNAADPDGEEPGFQIAPLIGVIFVLLLFFVATTVGWSEERAVVITLPESPVMGQTDWPRGGMITIEIAADGAVWAGGQSLDATQAKDHQRLGAWLKKRLAASEPGQPVVIRPSGDTPHQRVLEVLDAVTKTGVTHLIFG